MPVKSEAQRRFFYAVEEGKVKDVPKSVGREFIDASHGLTHLPEYAHEKAPPKHHRKVKRRY